MSALVVRVPYRQMLPRQRWLLYLSGGSLAAAGLGLGAAGLWLAARGGSGYYLATGLGLLGTAVLLMRGGAAGLWAFALLLVFTLAWSLLESGMDWWPLAARGAALAAAGVWLLSPWMRQALHRRSPVERLRPSRRLLRGVLIVFGILTLLLWTLDAANAPPRPPVEPPAPTSPDASGP